MSARYFSKHDDCLQNGSVTIIRNSRDMGCYVAHYINGDHISNTDIEGLGKAKKAAIEAEVAKLTTIEGLAEYAEKEFKAKAPECIGGSGR